MAGDKGDVVAWLTESQIKALRRAADHPLGVAEWTGARGLGAAAWRRMMDRLHSRGLFSYYPHGGYEITAAGREALEKARD